MKRRAGSVVPVSGWFVAAALATLVALGCDQPKPKARKGVRPTMSGFLDDYSRLHEGGKDELRWVYRKPDVDWTRYDAVLLEPVTLWRTGKESLDRVPEDDLQRLVNLFQRAVLERLGRGFRLVEEPGPGVMRIRLAITEAAGDDPVLDVLTASDDQRPSEPSGPLDPETRAFITRGAIEGEIRDAETGTLLAQGVDRRRPKVEPAASWEEVDARLHRWVDRTCRRLEARTGQP